MVILHNAPRGRLNTMRQYLPHQRADLLASLANQLNDPWVVVQAQAWLDNSVEVTVATSTNSFKLIAANGDCVNLWRLPKGFKMVVTIFKK